MYTAHHTFTSNLFSREQSTSREENSAQGWLSVDPKADAFPQATPYSAFLNNPVMMVDPGGDSTYALSAKTGRLMPIDGQVYGDSDNPMDRVIAENGSHFDVQQGVLSKRKVLATGNANVRNAVGISKEQEVEIVGFPMTDGETASDLFEWLSENSDVEWAQQTVKSEFGGNEFNILSTAGLPGSSMSSALEESFKSKYYLTLIGSTHSHPNGRIKPSDPDVDYLNSSPFPMAGRSIYAPEQGYRSYNGKYSGQNRRWDGAR